jgi:hypothetical protein
VLGEVRKGESGSWWRLMFESVLLGQ